MVAPKYNSMQMLEWDEVSGEPKLGMSLLFYFYFLLLLTAPMTGGIQAICERTMRVAVEAYTMLNRKVHWNGKAAVKVYGWQNIKMQGPVVAFNLLRNDGSFTGYAEVGYRSFYF